MDERKKHVRENPLLEANPFSKLFFCWLNPLFRTGYRQSLEVDDMYNVSPDDSAEYLVEKLEREWEKELSKTKDRSKPSLGKAMVRAFGGTYMLLGIIAFLEESVKVVQPVLLGQLIRYFTPGSGMEKWEAYAYAGGVSLCAMFIALAHHPYFFGVCRMGMWLRIACCSLLYKKSLKLNNTALGQTTTGQIVNIMSNDVNRFDQATLFLHFLWIGPLQALAVLSILWYTLGPASLAGFGVLILLIPLQGWMGKLFAKLRRKIAVQTDERVRIMNEVIGGMRVIKLYCWEKMFGQLIEKVRGQEIKRIMSAAYAKATIMVPFFCAAKVILYITVIAYIAKDGYLTPTKVFVALGLYQALRLVLTLFVPFAIQMGSEMLISLERIEEFLSLGELQESGNLEKSGLRPKKEDRKVVLQDVTASWDKVNLDMTDSMGPGKLNYDTPTLKDINLEVKAGELLAVIGPVGSGKSSLLMSILGELPASSGHIKVQGQVGYASQQPWVFSGTIRQNVTFGQPFDKDKYERVLKTCALNKDLLLMPQGDRTLVGEKGVSLSGGQRARISLARALYFGADVYLLDDPLSAVDAHVGRHIFDNCICGILKNKPRILVTHQLQYLTAADKIIILKDGEVADSGTYNELAESGVDFASLLKQEEEEEEEEDEVDPQLQATLSTESLHHKVTSMTSMFSSHMSVKSIGMDVVDEVMPEHEEEQRHIGKVGLGVYVEYFRAGSGILIFILLLLLNLLAQTAYVMSDYWLSYWTNEEELRMAAINAHENLLSLGFNSTNVSIPLVDQTQNIYIFTGITLALLLFSLCRALLFFHVTINASKVLHNRIFQSLIRAPIRFFDTNPVGRVLNRFSKDTGQMDEILPTTFFDFIQCLLVIVSIIIMIGVINPWVFLPTLPICILFLILRHYYLETARDIKRLESTTRSPVFSHISTSLEGLHTIRAYQAEDTFTREFDGHQDLHTEAHFLFLSTTRWFAIRLDWLCAFFVSSVCFCSVLAADSLNGGLVGLVVTYAMALMGLFQWGVRQSAEVENQMVSVERVLEYSKLPSEPPLESEEEKKPPPHWPKHGIITGEAVSYRYYDEGPFVLKNIYFCVRGREKVGIVGRTGAGKSSFISMLFRVAEAKGRLMIDGIDISEIGLHDLRKKISIIPQDPVLFMGTVRNNIDPFSEHSDDQLWRALEEVELKQAIEDLPGGLEAEISEGGSNFSVGQRQLVCLARAILRKNRILVIDEATANVDPRTDALIQQTIRQKFVHCTVLTIAHRLNTIMDSDRVMVLVEGKIKEFDEPYMLLQDENTYFSKMVEQTGKSESEDLLEIAKTAYFIRNQPDPSSVIPESQRSHLNSYIPSNHDGPVELETIV